MKLLKYYAKTGLVYIKLTNRYLFTIIEHLSIITTLNIEIMPGKVNYCVANNKGTVLLQDVVKSKSRKHMNPSLCLQITVNQNLYSRGS